MEIIFIKPRYESKELKILKYLAARKTLTKDLEKRYFKLKKGYEGEKLFDEWLQNYLSEGIILCDLLFEVNQTIFQIDTLLLRGSKIHLFEVKNFEGDFYLEKDKWFTIQQKGINSPLMQLDRIKALFQQLLHSLGYQESVEEYLVFVNPEFTLYQSPLNAPIIYPTQLNKFLKNLNNSTGKQSSSFPRLAKQLLSLHMEDSPFARIPKYNYEQLKKGIICKSCSTLIEHICTYRVVCGNCGQTEKLETAVLRQIEEFTLLFPDKKIMTSPIYEWCNIKRKRAIITILKKNFTFVEYGRSSYYVKEEEAKAHLEDKL